MEEEIISIRDFLVKVENGEITKEQLENWAAKGYLHRVVGTILKVVGQNGGPAWWADMVGFHAAITK